MQKKSEKAVIAFYDNQGRILLQDRKGITKAGEEWGFFGGGIEPGETPEQALIRELKEELDIDLKKVELLTQYKVFLPGDNLYNAIWLFVSPINIQIENLEQKEGRDMKFFTVDESRKLTMNKTDIDVIGKIKMYIKNKLEMV